MPTFTTTARFLDEFGHLTNKEQAAFRAAVRKLVADLRAGEVRAGFRVKRVKNRSGVWELTWADDGRATFEYGDEVKAGHVHVIWRRIGGHDILDNP